MIEQLLWCTIRSIKKTGVALETDDAVRQLLMTKLEEITSAEEGTDNDESEEEETTCASGARESNAAPVYVYDRCRRWLDGCSESDRKLFQKKLPIICDVAAGHTKHGKHGKQLRGGDGRVRVWETRLDKARRILWVRQATKEGGIEVYVHLVEENHDRISMSRSYAAKKALEVGLEDKIYSSHELSTAETSDVDGSHDSGEVMQDPFACGPTKVYRLLPTDDFGTLDGCWTERMRLTPGELKLVRQPGYLAIRGRSGTGKTVILQRRMMERAAAALAGEKVQVFVARSPHLCNTVKQGVPESCRNAMQFLTMAELLQRLGEALAVAQTDATPSVSFPDFEHGWKAFGAKHCGESALTHGRKFRQ
jgi:hypothetical protein